MGDAILLPSVNAIPKTEIMFVQIIIIIIINIIIIIIVINVIIIVNETEVPGEEELALPITWPAYRLSYWLLWNNITLETYLHLTHSLTFIPS